MKDNNTKDLDLLADALSLLHCGLTPSRDGTVPRETALLGAIGSALIAIVERLDKILAQRDSAAELDFPESEGTPTSLHLGSMTEREREREWARREDGG